MKFCSRSRSFGKHADSYSEDIPGSRAEEADSGDERDSTLFRTIGWISAGLGAVALGLFVGRELRLRYKFNHQTPYDFYAHAGDEKDVDFGLGI